MGCQGVEGISNAASVGGGKEEVPGRAKWALKSILLFFFFLRVQCGCGIGECRRTRSRLSFLLSSGTCRFFTFFYFFPSFPFSLYLIPC
ncbi:hypothetical protein AHAS_Ahas15G0002100 [Arachis hypogaea]